MTTHFQRRGRSLFHFLQGENGSARWWGLILAAAMGLTALMPARVTQAVDAEAAAPTVAVFVKNHASKAYDDKVAALEDLIAARLAEQNISVISRDDVINAVAGFASEGPNAGDAAEPGAKLDAILSNNTSALRLAQMLGADYIMTASIVAVNHNVKTFAGYGVERTIFESVMRLTYKVSDRVKGGSVTGGTAEASVKSPYQVQATVNAAQEQLNVYAETNGVVDQLLDEASKKLVDHLVERRKKVDAVVAAPGMVKWTVICGTAGLMVPTITKAPDNQFVVSDLKLPVNPENVTVELNGAVVGTAPGTFEVPPGLSKLRLSREGYDAIERTVNVVEGQTLRIDLRMSDAEYARWKDQVAFLEAIKNGAKLTDAEAERVRGLAQMFRQSGYKIDYHGDVSIKSDVKIDDKSDVKIDEKSDVKKDIKSDIKVDTDQPVQIHQKNQSLWQDVQAGNVNTPTE